jgi:hypothetical protein
MTRLAGAFRRATEWEERWQKFVLTTAAILHQRRPFIAKRLGLPRSVASSKFHRVMSQLTVAIALATFAQKIGADHRKGGLHMLVVCSDLIIMPRGGPPSAIPITTVLRSLIPAALGSVIPVYVAAAHAAAVPREQRCRWAGASGFVVAVVAIHVVARRIAEAIPCNAGEYGGLYENVKLPLFYLSRFGLNLGSTDESRLLFIAIAIALITTAGGLTHRRVTRQRLAFEAWRDITRGAATAATLWFVARCVLVVPQVLGERATYGVIATGKLSNWVSLWDSWLFYFASPIVGTFLAKKLCELAVLRMPEWRRRRAVWQRASSRSRERQVRVARRRARSVVRH